MDIVPRGRQNQLFNRRNVAIARAVADAAYRRYGRGAYNAARRAYRNRDRPQRRGRGPPAKRRRTQGRRRGYRGRAQSRLSTRGRVHRLERQLGGTMSTLTFKDHEFNNVSTDNAAIKYDVTSLLSKNEIQAALDQMLWFDSTTNDYLKKDPDTCLNHNIKMKIDSCYTRFLVKNSQNYPVKVTLYLLSPKTNTGTQPTATIDTALADEVTTSVAMTKEQNHLVYPTELDYFKKQWTILRTKKKLLVNGATMSMTTVLKNIRYSPDWMAENTEKYQKRMKSRLILMRIDPVMGHQQFNLTQLVPVPDATTVSLGRGGVDISLKRIMKIKYDSGGPATRYTYIDMPLPSSTDVKCTGDIINRSIPAINAEQSLH